VTNDVAGKRSEAMTIEQALGRSWRARAAGVLVVAGLAAGTQSAGAERLVVTNKHQDGPGSLRAVVAEANRTEAKDTLSFGRMARKTIRVSRDLKVTRSLTIDGADRVTLIGPQAGRTLTVSSADHRPKAKLRIKSLKLKRIGVVSDPGDGLNGLVIADSVLSGDGVDMPGVDLEAFSYTEPARVASSRISGFPVGVQAFYNDVEVDDSTISGNGTGLSVIEAGGEVTDSLISGNSPGGGIDVLYYAGVNVARSTITGNTTEAGNGQPATGGGVDASYFAFATIQNSTVSGNVAAGAGSMGGGIYGNAKLVASTVTDNSANQGGGLFSTATEHDVLIADSIVAGNSAPSDPDCAGQGEFVPPAPRGHNLFGPEGCLAPAPGDILTANPGLGPLADNGGPTPTHALLPGSPAIDAAEDLGLKTDQRGVKRGTPPDIGSFELRGGG
jgi:hypothetical protein